MKIVAVNQVTKVKRGETIEDTFYIQNRYIR